MVKTSQIIESCVNHFPGINLILRPTERVSKKMTNERLKKYTRYLELYLIFPFKLMSARIRFSIKRILIVDHSDAIHLFYFRRNSAVTIVHDQFAYLASKSMIPGIKIRIWGRIHQKIIHLGLKRSKKLLAVSEYTKLILLGLKISQQINILNLTWKPWPLTSETTVNKILIPKMYGVLVSAESWRKNRTYAINVINKLRDFSQLNELELIIIGDELSPNELSKLTSSNLDFVRFMKNVSDEDLKFLYENALFCIATSRYEGYGLPLLEANSLGIVCLHNQIPSFMEITNPYNILLTNNFDENNWAEIETKLMNSKMSTKLAGFTEQKFGLNTFSSNLRKEFFF